MSSCSQCPTAPTGAASRPRVAMASFNGWMRALSTESASQLQAHEDTVVALAYSPDGRTLASASLDETIRVWDVGSGKQAADALMGHTNDVNSVVYSPNGQRIVSGSTDGTVRVWPAVAGPKELCDKFD